FGLFVKLNDLLIDGLVHISHLDNGYYHFDSDRQRLVGKNGNIYRLGDPVKVQVMSVNLDDKKIDFDLITNLRKPKSVGKTAKKKGKKSSTVFKEVKKKNIKKSLKKKKKLNQL
ncbi:S1 RNA-binding domain-containing protein, partial [Otariodibacter sp.]|uniref:S1 RNA-binding domain-containing protein n=1 Tax=Otariodibacter sp. TaxID=3030919 RepID=UPI00260F761C